MNKKKSGEKNKSLLLCVRFGTCVFSAGRCEKQIEKQVVSVTAQVVSLGGPEVSLSTPIARSPPRSLSKQLSLSLSLSLQRVFLLHGSCNI